MTSSRALSFCAGSLAWAAPALAGDVAGKVTHEGPTEGPVVVYVKSVPGATPSRERVASVAQRNIQFAPTGVVVTAGAKVDFPNQDKTFHNVFSLTPGSEFDLGLYREGASQSTTLASPGEVDVYCNIHPDMAMKILVLQNDFFAVVGADGTYTIPAVPAGEWTLVAWAPDLQPTELPVKVGADGAVTMDFALARRPGSEPHTNKAGEQYGRYR